MLKMTSKNLTNAGFQPLLTNDLWLVQNRPPKAARHQPSQVPLMGGSWGDDDDECSTLAGSNTYSNEAQG